MIFKRVLGKKIQIHRQADTIVEKIAARAKMLKSCIDKIVNRYQIFLMKLDNVVNRYV